jgi:hypothetical protein
MTVRTSVREAAFIKLPIGNFNAFRCISIVFPRGVFYSSTTEPAATQLGLEEPAQAYLIYLWML